jgi:hypothetical protein
MTTTTFQSVLEWALFYHREGFSVIPLKSEPASDRKRPAVDWKEYSEQRASEEQVRQWFSNGSNYNIAVVMGKVSGCALGIDIDGPLAWQHYEAKLEAPGHENLRSTLINTMMNKTGSGGCHVIVKVDPGEDYDQVRHIIKNNEIWSSEEAHSQIRIQTEGMYLVMPPSVHPNGKLYKWNEKLPSLIRADDLAQFVELVGGTNTEEQYPPTPTLSTEEDEHTKKVITTPTREEVPPVNERKTNDDDRSPHVDPDNRMKQRLESAEIVDMRDGSRQLAVNGRRSGSFIELNNKRGMALKLRTVRYKLEQLCAEQDIDPGSNANLEKCAQDAYVNYQKEKRRQERQQKEQEQQQAAKEKEPRIELTPDLTKEVTFKDIGATLETTIKKDEPAKLITFCGMLNAQTEDDQFNVGYQEQSSSGKSYIPLEVSAYFPSDEVIDLGGATPTAFAHEQGEWDYDRNAMIVLLEAKIMIFIDMPDYRLLQKLRPMLSHDKKEIQYKATDKSERHGLRTKTAIVRGYPSVFFCTTSTDLDEQESTRLMLVSPETTQEKIDESLRLLALRRSNYEKYRKVVLGAPGRIWLSNRIKAVRQTKIREVILPEDGARLYKKFKEDHPYLLPRHQRDFPRIIALVKAHALLNVFNREKVGDNDDAILATQTDIDAGLDLYSNIESSNELGLSPYTYQIYEKAVKPILEPNVPLTRKDIRQQFFKAFRRTLPEKQESNILSQLEAAGLIVQDVDPNDKRKTVVFYPTHRGDISSEPAAAPTADPKKPDDGPAITKESVEKYIRQVCGVNTEKAGEILEQLNNGKDQDNKEKEEEEIQKNVQTQVVSGDNDQTTATTATPHTAGIYDEQPGKSAYEAWVAASLADLKEFAEVPPPTKPEPPAFKVPCSLCDFQASNRVPDAAIYAVAVRHGFAEHPGHKVGEMLREMGYVTPSSVNNAGDGGNGDNEKQRQEEAKLATYFACPEPGCEEQLEGPFKLLEHIHEHCPEREKGTRWWLQARGLLPEEEEEHRS